MDKKFLFDLLVEKAESHADFVLQDGNEDLFVDMDLEEGVANVLIDTVIFEVNKRKELPLPTCDLHNDSTVDNLRKEYNDNVAIVSAILNIISPDKYFFYNPLTFENELFEGVQFFSDVVPEFEALEFDKVGSGKRRFDNYLKLNKSLFDLANRLWPDIQCPYYHISFLLYDCIGSLFIEYSDYNRYWIIAASEDGFEVLNKEEKIGWSGKKGMQQGDKVFVYKTSPVSAITDIFEVEQEPYFDQVSSWGGFWVDIKRICKIPPIAFSEMRKDPVLSDWWVVKKQFTGTITDPVSFSIYNRFLELIPDDIKIKHQLKPEPVAEHGVSGMFDSEHDFEDKVVTPLLKRFDIKYDRQHTCRFYAGTQTVKGRVDYVLYRKNKPYTLIENKLRIINDVELQKAVNQAKSYALQLGVERFVVASPEGYWFYSLKLNKEELVERVPGDQASGAEELLSSHFM